MAPGTAPFSKKRRITVWGAPSTGKTTFLAALNLALDDDAGWRVIGGDEASADMLSKFERALVKERVFPEATPRPELYRWELHGSVRRKVRTGRFRSRQEDQPVVIPLELVDAPGGAADPVSAGAARSRALFENMEESSGLAFFFDPVRELERRDAFEHTNSVINSVSQRMHDRLLPGGLLPHYVAVCVTKFDELPLVTSAQRLGMIDYDARGVPHVPTEDAREFLMEICKRFGDRSPDRVLGRLERHFDTTRIKYFITSAIGFYVDPGTGRCDMADFQNHIPPAPGRPAGIRGDVDPINVAEPILWLAQADDE
jgi:hypothetical protein